MKDLLIILKMPVLWVMSLYENFSLQSNIHTHTPLFPCRIVLNEDWVRVWLFGFSFVVIFFCFVLVGSFLFWGGERSLCVIVIFKKHKYNHLHAWNLINAIPLYLREGRKLVSGFLKLTENELLVCIGDFLKNFIFLRLPVTENYSR